MERKRKKPSLKKRLNDPEYAQIVSRKIKLHRTRGRFATKISELKQKLETAEGKRRQQILKMIETLEKARDVYKKGLFQK